MRILLIMPDAHMHKLRNWLVRAFDARGTADPHHAGCAGFLIYPGLRSSLWTAVWTRFHWTSQPIWWGSASSRAALAQPTHWPNISVSAAFPLCSVGFM